MRPDDLVQLRPDGLYCPPADLYIDPSGPVARAWLTHAHADHARAGSTHYFAQRDALAILRHRLGAEASVTPLAYGEVTDVGGVRVSLHPAGHILGSSQVRLEHRGEVWVVTGDYKRDDDPTCPAFEVVPCDALITEATFALPVYRWRPPQETVDEVLAWWRHCAALGRNAVLCCYALGKAQRVLAGLLGRADRPVLLHGAMEPLVAAYRAAGVALAETAPVKERARGEKMAGELILAPPSAAGSTWMRRFGDCEVGFASGWMQVRGDRRRKAYDRGFVLSDHADWPGLLRTIAETGARRVIATHGFSDALARYAREALGLDAEVLSAGYAGEEAD
jgi:putative mRNA 3-end processing factor